jgi:hypothetical protein
MPAEIVICSIAKKQFEPTGFLIKRSYNYNALHIRPCEENEKYTTLVVRDHEDVRVVHTEYDASKAERIPVTVTAQQIVNDFFANEQLAQKGCFILNHAFPTAQELDLAHSTRRQYLQQCVNFGNVEYSRTQRVDDIPGAWKRACEELGVETEWAFIAPPEMFNCPACAERLRVGVAICKACGAVLDREKAEEFGLLQEAAPVAPRKTLVHRRVKEKPKPQPEPQPEPGSPQPHPVSV